MIASHESTAGRFLTLANFSGLLMRVTMTRLQSHCVWYQVSPFNIRLDTDWETRGLLLKLEKCRFTKRGETGSPEMQGGFPGRFRDSGTRIELQQRCEESENILREFLMMRTFPPIVEA